MEPIRFADILFTAITLLIVYLILYWVNKGRQKNKASLPEEEIQVSEQVQEELDENKDSNI